MTTSSECDKITFVLSEDKTYFTIISRRFSHGKRHDKGKSASGHSAVYAAADYRKHFPAALQHGRHDYRWPICRSGCTGCSWFQYVADLSADCIQYGGICWCVSYFIPVLWSRRLECRSAVCTYSLDACAYSGNCSYYRWNCIFTCNSQVDENSGRSNESVSSVFENLFLWTGF